MFKKADFVLLFLLLALGISTAFFSLQSGSRGEEVSITVDGKLYGIYLLSEDQVIRIHRENHTNNIIIKHGTVQMASSNCKNQICVRSGRISKPKETIVCLPNKVVVEILPDKKDKGGGIDVISD